MNILGIEVCDVGRAEALERTRAMLKQPGTHIITTPNPEIVLSARRSFFLRRIINESDLRLADGFGLRVAAFLLGERLRHRVPGTDFAESLMASLDAGTPVFLLGGKNERAAQAAASRLSRRYPNIKIAGAVHGGAVIVSKTSCETEDNTVVSQINQSGARIVFVGFGCPKQERWMRAHSNELSDVSVLMAVGGAIDFWAGEAKRAPKIVRTIGLEWLWRLIVEPRRVKRITNATFGFLGTVIAWRIRMMTTYRKNVAACIVNQKKEVLIVERAYEDPGHWQLPQGGVDKGESDEAAVLREVREETGIAQLAILGKNSKAHQYDWPRWHRLNGGYRGQRQTLFFLHYPGDGSDVSVDEHEIRSSKWVPIAALADTVHAKRKHLARLAQEGYTHYI